MTQPQRPITVMFADVSGSARLFERLGDGEAAHAVERCMKRMTRAIEAYRGRTVQVVGDELLAAFESSEDACQAAVDMQGRVADLPPVSGLKLTIRIGLHYGPVQEASSTLTGTTIINAARIAGLARHDQILASSRLVESLPADTLSRATPQPTLGRLQEGDTSLRFFEINWVRPVEVVLPLPSTNGAVAKRLSVRYRGKTLHVDEQNAKLTLGRDPASKLLIEDRKASRVHGKIERRANGYFYTDSSSNGSFVCFSGQNESLLRHDEILLQGSGRICFGSSGNDANADCIDFEHLQN